MTIAPQFWKPSILTEVGSYKCTKNKILQKTNNEPFLRIQTCVFPKVQVPRTALLIPPNLQLFATPLVSEVPV